MLRASDARQNGNEKEKRRESWLQWKAVNGWLACKQRYTRERGMM